MISNNSNSKKEKKISFDAGGSDYFILLKPRVMSLVVFTATIGMLVAPGHIEVWRGCLAILCIALGGGASGALNMWYDADIDAIMKRTKSRPIPAGKITSQNVFWFGFILAILSVVALGFITNWFAGLFLAFTIFFYVVIYTIFLKRTTVQNIVIGGAAGAFPPMVGYACVDPVITWQSFSLFLLIFLWTPPHFWSLCLFAATDYEAANIPMLPNVYGVRSTQNHILGYSVLMALAAIWPYYLFGFGGVYLLFSIILGLYFIFYAFKLWKINNSDLLTVIAKKLFYFSLLYLALIFAAIMVEFLVKSWFGISL